MSIRLQEYRDAIEKSLKDRSKPWTRYFDIAESKTGVSRVYLFVGKFGFKKGIYLYL